MGPQFGCSASLSGNTGSDSPGAMSSPGRGRESGVATVLAESGGRTNVRTYVGRLRDHRAHNDRRIEAIGL